MRSFGLPGLAALASVVLPLPALAQVPSDFQPALDGGAAAPSGQAARPSGAPGGFAGANAAVFTGDTLFKDSVGGGNVEQVRHSVMEVLMKLPPETRVLPGHTDETTIGREWEQNPFVVVWRGEQPEGTERVRVAGEDATLIVWSPDYDGGGKAWVRFADGRDAIVGGSRVER